MKLLPAPWTGEPDEVDFTDDATGYPIAMRRNGVGAWCGYVGVPKTHAWHGRKFSYTLPMPEGFLKTRADTDKLGGFGVLLTMFALDDGLVRLDSLIPCHKGMNYADAAHWGDDARASWWFGFDCSHCGDLAPGNPFAWMFDDEEYRRLDYVREVCVRMAAELAFYARMK